MSDKFAFPLAEGDSHVISLWYSSSGNERSAELEGALKGEERDKLWEELRVYLIETVEDGKEEGKEEGKAGEGKEEAK